MSLNVLESPAKSRKDPKRRFLPPYLCSGKLTKESGRRTKDIFMWFAKTDKNRTPVLGHRSVPAVSLQWKTDKGIRTKDKRQICFDT